MNTKTIGVIVALILVGGGAFYAGTVYQQGQTASTASTRGQYGNGQGAAGGARGGMRAGSGFSSGTVVTLDANDMSIKLPSGSTQIILLSTSTQVMKSAAGTLADLSQGAMVTVTGASNSDGSITAQSVQIRPAGAARPQQQ